MIGLAMPIYLTVEAETVQSLANLGGAGPLKTITGMTTERARNYLTYEWLNAPVKPTHVLWVDADMVFPANALERLLALDLPIVSALYFSRHAPYQPLLSLDGVSHVKWAPDYPDDARLEVHATGAGFLLVKLEVFEEIRTRFSSKNFTLPHTDPQWAEWWQPRKANCGEDFAFCDRARECGYKIIVDTGLKLGHVGRVTIDETFSQRMAASPRLTKLLKDMIDAHPAEAVIFQAELKKLLKGKL